MTPADRALHIVREVLADPDTEPEAAHPRLPAIAQWASEHPGSFLCLPAYGSPVIYPDARRAALRAAQGGVCRLVRIPD